MNYIKTSISDDIVRYLYQQITKAVRAGKQVLWLVSGGSAIDIAVKTAKKLGNGQQITVTLTDERFGSVGHSDSNWQQLLQAGFALPGALLLPVLQGETVYQTTKTFEQNLQNALLKADFKIGLFGMGVDGHTAGILPYSLVGKTSDLAIYYQGSDYRRITIANSAIKQLDEAVLYAIGEAKKPALEQLQQDVSVASQPVQILKQVKSLTIFNDQIGESK